jgi:peptidoglycan biosynthesis protein MviN/MurJ (putative lipid II flippase)
MSHTPLIPPHEAEPKAWQRGEGKFNWRRALLGTLTGGVIGTIALFLGASPWWWLLVAIGFAHGSVTRQSFDVPISWLRG